MGNEAYEERRRLEKERRLAEEREIEEREKRENATERCADLLVAAVTDFLEGRASLVIEPVNNVTIVRFQRD